MTSDEAHTVVLLDSTVLDRLRQELDNDDGVWKVFIQDFVAHLPFRIDRLRVALTTGDPDSAKDAVLGLKTASQMVGAERLARLAFSLELALRAESSQSAPSLALPRLAAAHLKRIKQCAQKTIYLLESRLQHYDAAPVARPD